MKKYRLRERQHEDLIADLLAARGVADQEEIEKFLIPDFERDSGDPILLPDMPAAVERIRAARQADELVCVWSDYDADGIPGGVLLTQFLRDIGMRVVHYIPHRHREGYGLNTQGLDELALQGVGLVITVDLGTTDEGPIAHAKKKGIDVIVTDHHLVPTEKSTSQKSSGSPQTFVQQILPPALAVINPKRLDNKYPFDGLCGAGVAWKLVQALVKNLELQNYPAGKEKWLLDLAGLATLSDMVPLRGENRMLAHFGLRVMRRNRRPGLAALLQLLRIKPAGLTEDDVGFMISPRINAASRMDSPQAAARLLAAADESEAADLAAQLNAINDERKGLVAATVKEVNKRLALAPVESPLIVMGNPNWRPGILGLVANSLAEAHGKSVFLWGREGGEAIRGSCRSDGATNIVEVMSGAKEIFEDFGGHFAAGGFSLPQERVHELPQRLQTSFEALRAKGTPVHEVVIDRELELAEVPRARRELQKLAPFGIGNEKPLFVLPRVSITRTRMFGKAREHLEAAFEKSGEEIQGVAFFSTPDSFTKKVSGGEVVDVVGHVETDWRGGPRVRIVEIL